MYSIIIFCIDPQILMISYCMVGKIYNEMQYAQTTIKHFIKKNKNRDENTQTMEKYFPIDCIFSKNCNR